MTDTCEHCGLPVYVMPRPRVAPKLVHRGTHLAECHTGGTTAARKSAAPPPPVSGSGQSAPEPARVVVHVQCGRCRRLLPSTTAECDCPRAMFIHPHPPRNTDRFRERR
ncbi:hypothetical protein HMPREF0724_12154 [Prescottella equi ATCC 33707]|uniref:Uncharacterized protein n=1 Tax=Prescottella equi ATCC 33707 TaxID=525370 RepID=E9T0J5_RHOHA|nr:hypothetical protein HMPREF0724_12154 [Prescottella equi ATCC 33707]